MSDNWFNRRTVLRGLGGAGAAGALAGCVGNGDDADDADDFDDTDDTDDEDVIRIGYFGSLTGPMESHGNEQLRGVEVGAELINEAGGIDGQTLEIESIDTEGDVEVGQRRIRAALGDGIDLFLGGSSTAVALALNSVLEDEGGMQMSTGHATEITGEDCHERTFRTYLDNGYARNRALADAIHDDMSDVDTWAIVSPDYAYGHDVSERFMSRMEEVNPDAELLVETYPAFLQGEYSDEISAVLSEEPDAIYSALFGGDMFAFVNQGVDFGLWDEIPLLATGHLSLDVPRRLDPLPDTWWLGTTYTPLPRPVEEPSEFDQAHMDSYDVWPESNAGGVYAGLQEYKRLIEETGSTDPDVLIETLRDDWTQDNDIHGSYPMRANNQALTPITVLKLQPGDMEHGYDIPDYRRYEGDEAEEYYQAPEDSGCHLV